MSQESVFESFRSWSPEAFWILYEAHIRAVYDFCFYRVHDKNQAEEIVSDVFFKVYTNSASFHGKTDAEFSSYLRTVAYRRIVDEFRSHQENVDLEDVQEVIGVEEEHSKKIDATNSIQEVLKYLDTLPRRQKDIVLMAVWDELSYKEIANICGITEANCRQIVSRTLRQIEANVVFLLGLFFIFYR